jgi:hypothetical protein
MLLFMKDSEKTPWWFWLLAAVGVVSVYVIALSGAAIAPP